MLQQHVLNMPVCFPCWLGPTFLSYPCCLAGNAFENLTDARRTLREIMLLRLLKHDNIIGVRDILKPQSKDKDKFNDVYLVYELMDTDLHQIIRSSQPLTNEHFQFFIYQVSKIQFFHQANQDSPRPMTAENI